MKIIIITGINGFLGSHLAKNLSKEYKIIGLVNNVDRIHRIKDNLFMLYSSITEIETVFKENNVFAIIHAATIYRRENGLINELINTNVLLPIKLYELGNRYNVNYFLNIDSFFNDSKYKYNYLSEYTLSKKHHVLAIS